MNILRITILGAVAAVGLSVALPAMAADAFRFSFDTGAVRMGYTDGYWDNSHQWHNWRNAREAREYRARYKDHYMASKHSRLKNGGWRDSDGDGVPNRSDDHPNNPRRD